MASKKALPRGAGSWGGPEEGVNIQVILRCRPATKDEIASRTPQVVKCNEALREITMNQTVGGKQFGRTYHFDRVFPGDTGQEKLYGSTVAPMVEEMLEGFNCTIFAYGQTGTGKTYTMTGDLNEGSAEMSASAGVIPRAIHQIFEYLDGLGAQEYTVKASYLELYNEEVTDLLAVGADPPKVRILEDRAGVVLNGLEEAQVHTSADIYTLLDQGTAKRRTAETLLNKQSSRSHTVFIVTVSVRETLAEGEEVIRVGKLYLVDLAGSENVTRSGAVDVRAKEAGNINKSLLTLGRVITALVEGQCHVPYRDSKLTRLLRDSLGGRTKTCIIATIAPTVQCQEETLSTLEYAHRAKNIKNRPEVNQRISKTTHIKEMSAEIEKLKLMLYATREKNGVYLPAAQYEEECAERKFLQTRVEELESAAETAQAAWETEKAKLVDKTAAERAAAKQELDARQAQLESATQRLDEITNLLEETRHVVSEQRKHESLLAGHAITVTNELSGALADIARLFARVDAKQGIEDENVALVRAVRVEIHEALSRTRERLGATARDVSQACQASKDALSAQRARREQEEILAEDNLVSSLRQHAKGLHDSAVSGLEAVEAALIAGNDALRESTVKLMVAMKEDATQVHKRLVSAGKETTQSLEQAESRIKSFGQKMRADCEARSQETIKLGEAGSEALALTARNRVQVQKDLERHRLAVLGSLSGVTSGLEEALNEGRERVMRSVQETISSWAEEARAKLEAETKALADHVTNELGVLEARANEERKAAQETSRQVQADARALCERLGANGAEAAEFLATTTAMTTAVREVLDRDVLSGAESDWNKALNTADSFERNNQSHADQTLAAIQAANASLRSGPVCDAQNSLTESLDAMIDTAHARRERAAAAEEAIERAAQQAERAAQEGAAAAEQHVDSIASRLDDAVDNQYRTDTNATDLPNRGERPTRTERDVTAHRAPSEQLLIASWHAAKANGGGSLMAAEQENIDTMRGGREDGLGQKDDDDASPRTEGEDVESQENRSLAGNRTLSLEVPPSGLKPPMVLSPGLSGVKRGRSAPSTPRDARASSRVATRRGTRRATAPSDS